MDEFLKAFILKILIVSANFQYGYLNLICFIKKQIHFQFK